MRLTDHAEAHMGVHGRVQVRDRDRYVAHILARIALYCLVDYMFWPTQGQI